MISGILKEDVIYAQRGEASAKVLSRNSAAEEPQPESQDLAKLLKTHPVKTWLMTA